MLILLCKCRFDKISVGVAGEIFTVPCQPKSHGEIDVDGLARPFRFPACDQFGERDMLGQQGEIFAVDTDCLTALDADAIPRCGADLGRFSQLDRRDLIGISWQVFGDR